MAASADYRRRFIDFMLDCEVLRFGDFVTKSGRETPYFINTGHYDEGRRLRLLGEFYATAIAERLGDEFDVLYGPAYKGIPLAVATGIALERDHGIVRGVAFNRKEAKGHGEKGRLIGHSIADGDRIVLIDDVVTAGTSVRESAELLRGHAEVTLKALVVSVDRQERGQGSESALQEVARTHQLDAFAIVTLDDIVGYLRERLDAGDAIVGAEFLGRIEAYRRAYGA